MRPHDRAAVVDPATTNCRCQGGHVHVNWATEGRCAAMKVYMCNLHAGIDGRNFCVVRSKPVRVTFCAVNKSGDCREHR